MAKLTPMLRIVVSTRGSTQLGFLTMSAKVAPGEKKTPTTRENGLRAPCVSGAGMGLVAIEDSSTTRLRSTASEMNYARPPGNISAGGILTQKRGKLTVATESGSSAGKAG